ncbi:MAG: hypothetical protein JO306_01705, partial [Gemmatimonadetes bacterium]|nr:hypothetical protein [Gemmatimonadota bacterium]
MNDRIHRGPLAVRVFLIDDSSGKPAAGTVVSLSVDEHDGNTRLLATMRTDGAGYVAFKFDASAVAGAARLRVTQAGAPGDALVLSAADALAGYAHTIRLNAADRVRAKHLGLPAVKSPDAVDFALSPGSIGMTPQLLPA